MLVLKINGCLKVCGTVVKPETGKGGLKGGDKIREAGIMIGNHKRE